MKCIWKAQQGSLLGGDVMSKRQTDGDVEMKTKVDEHDDECGIACAIKTERKRCAKRKRDDGCPIDPAIFCTIRNDKMVTCSKQKKEAQACTRELWTTLLIWLIRVSLSNMVVRVSHTLRVVQGTYRKRQVWNKRGEESKFPAGKKDQRTQVNTAPRKKME
eukprot:2345747-Pleurochrysis_carterae.AAC.1